MQTTSVDSRLPSPNSFQNRCFAIGITLLALGVLAAFSSFISPHISEFWHQHQFLHIGLSGGLIGVSLFLMMQKSYNKSLNKVLLYATLIAALSAIILPFVPNGTLYALGAGAFAGGMLFTYLALKRKQTFSNIRDALYTATSQERLINKHIRLNELLQDNRKHAQVLDLKSGVNSLLQQGPLHPAALLSYGRLQERDNEKPFYMVTNYFHSPATTLQAACGGEIPKSPIAFISVPILLQGPFEDHIVHIRIDLRNQPPTMTFYDPKGLSIEDYDAVPLKTNPNKNLRRVVAELESKFNVKLTTQNAEKQQTDNHNSGVFVLMDCKYRGAPPGHLQMTSVNMNNQGRQELIKDLLDDFQVNTGRYNE